jgi:hypothetical protein
MKLFLCKLKKNIKISKIKSKKIRWEKNINYLKNICPLKIYQSFYFKL